MLDRERWVIGRYIPKPKPRQSAVLRNAGRLIRTVYPQLVLAYLWVRLHNPALQQHVIPGVLLQNGIVNQIDPTQHTVLIQKEREDIASGQLESQRIA